MNIFDRIKSFFNKNQLKELPEGVISVNDENEWRRTLRYDISSSNNSSKEVYNLKIVLIQHSEECFVVMKN